MVLPVDDQTDHHLICEKAITDQHMAHQALACCLIIGLDMEFLHVGDHAVQHLLILGYAKGTVTVLNNAVGASCIKTCDDPAIF